METKKSTVDNYQLAQSWYDDLYLAKEKQLKIFQGISLGLILLLCLSLVSVATLITRETVQPFLALVDKRTGEVTTPTRLNADVTLMNWNMIRHSVKTFVLNKESYSSNNVNEPYQTVLSMSDDKVKAQIDKDLRPELNPNSPIKQLGQQFYITVTIHSINKLSRDNLIDIRFTTHTVNSQTHHIERSKEWRATLKWALVNKKRTLLEWDNNPLGFTVSFYDKQPIVA